MCYFQSFGVPFKIRTKAFLTYHKVTFSDNIRRPKFIAISIDLKISSLTNDPREAVTQNMSDLNMLLLEAVYY
jgi:hypothetical protein